MELALRRIQDWSLKSDECEENANDLHDIMWTIWKETIDALNYAEACEMKQKGQDTDPALEEKGG